MGLHLHYMKLDSQTPTTSAPYHLCSCKDCHIHSCKIWYLPYLKMTDPLCSLEKLLQTVNVQMWLCGGTGALAKLLFWLGLSSCCHPLSHLSAPWLFTFAVWPRRTGREISLHAEIASSELMLCAYQAKANFTDTGMCGAKGSSKWTMRDCSLMPFGWEIMRFSPSLPLGFSCA